MVTKKTKVRKGPATQFDGQRLEVRFSAKDYEEAERAAALEGLTLSAFVRMAVRTLAQRRLKKSKL